VNNATKEQRTEERKKQAVPVLESIGKWSKEKQYTCKITKKNFSNYSIKQNK